MTEYWISYIIIEELIIDFLCVLRGSAIYNTYFTYQTKILSWIHMQENCVVLRNTPCLCNPAHTRVLHSVLNLQYISHNNELFKNIKHYLVGSEIILTLIIIFLLWKFITYSLN